MERLRKKEQRKAREERQRQLREETKRLQNESRSRQAAFDLEAEEDKRRRLLKHRRIYDERWAKLLEVPPNDSSESVEELLLEDIPWPLPRFQSSKRTSRFSVDLLL